MKPMSHGFVCGVLLLSPCAAVLIACTAPADAVPRAHGAVVVPSSCVALLNLAPLPPLEYVSCVAAGPRRDAPPGGAAA